MDDVIAAREAYYKAFGNPGPRPMEVSDSFMARVLLDAVRNGREVPDDFDWYPDLPKDAVV